MMANQDCNACTDESRSWMLCIVKNFEAVVGKVYLNLVAIACEVLK